MGIEWQALDGPAANAHLHQKRQSSSRHKSGSAGCSVHSHTEVNGSDEDDEDDEDFGLHDLDGLDGLDDEEREQVEAANEEGEQVLILTDAELVMVIGFRSSGEKNDTDTVAANQRPTEGASEGLGAGSECPMDISAFEKYKDC